MFLFSVSGMWTCSATGYFSINLLYLYYCSNVGGNIINVLANPTDLLTLLAVPHYY